jgi:hypothetical protein
MHVWPLLCFFSLGLHGPRLLCPAPPVHPLFLFCFLSNELATSHIDKFLSCNNSSFFPVSLKTEARRFQAFLYNETSFWGRVWELCFKGDSNLCGSGQFLLTNVPCSLAKDIWGCCGGSFYQCYEMPWLMVLFKPSWSFIHKFYCVGFVALAVIFGESFSSTWCVCVCVCVCV